MLRCWEYSRNPLVRGGCNGSGHCGGEIVNDQIAGHAAKKAHVASKPAITSSSFWLCVGQTKQCREYDSTMISARTTLRLPVARSVIIPNLPMSASAISLGTVSAIRTVRTLRPPQFRFRINRRNDVHDTVQPAPTVTSGRAPPSTGRRCATGKSGQTTEPDYLQPASPLAWDGPG